MIPIDSGQERGAKIFGSLVAAKKGPEIIQQIKAIMVSDRSKRADQKLLPMLQAWIQQKQQSQPDFFKGSHLFSKVLQKLDETTTSSGARIARAVGGVFRHATTQNSFSQDDKELDRVILDGPSSIVKFNGSSYQYGSYNFKLPDSKKIFSTLLRHVEVGSIKDNQLNEWLCQSLPGGKWLVTKENFDQAIPLLEVLEKNNPALFVKVFKKIIGSISNCTSELGSTKLIDEDKPYLFLKKLAETRPDSVLKTLSEVMGHNNDQNQRWVARGLSVLKVLAEKHPEKLKPFLKSDVLSCLKEVFFKPASWPEELCRHGDTFETETVWREWNEVKIEDIRPILAYLAKDTSQHKYVRDFLGKQDPTDSKTTFLDLHPVECLPILAQLAKDTSQHKYVRDFLGKQDPTDRGKTFLDQHPLECLPILAQLAKDNSQHNFVRNFLDKKDPNDPGKTFLDQYSVECLPILTELAKHDLQHDFVKEFLTKIDPAGHSKKTFLDQYSVECLPILTELAKHDLQHNFVRNFLDKKDPNDPGKTFLDQHPVECFPVLTQLASVEDYRDFVMEFLSKEGPATQDKRTLLDRVPIECLPLLEELAKGNKKCQGFVWEFLSKGNPVDGKTFLEQHFIECLPVLKQSAEKDGLSSLGFLFMKEPVEWRIEKTIPLLNVLVDKPLYRQELIKFFATENFIKWQGLGSLRPIKNIVPILKFLADNKVDCLKKVFVTPNNQGLRLLDDCRSTSETLSTYTLADIAPVFDKLVEQHPELLLDIFMTQSRPDRLPPLLMENSLSSFLNNFSDNELMKFLSVDDPTGLQAEIKIKFFDGYPDKVLRLLAKLTEKAESHQFVIEFLSKENLVEGKTFLDQYFIDSLPVLELLAENKNNHEALRKWLSKKDQDEKTIFHQRPFFDQAVFLITLLGGKSWLQTLDDKYGLNPLESLELSDTWLTSKKDSIGELTPGLTEPFETRVQNLQTSVDEIWGKLEFGKKPGQVPLGFCAIKKITDKPAVQLSKEQIKKDGLDQLLNKIKTKDTYGAPDDEGARDNYYVEMLTNLECIIDHLTKKNDTLLTAGTLIHLATPRLVGYCASRDMREIKLRVRELSGRTLDNVVEEAGNDALIYAIDKCTSERSVVIREEHMELTVHDAPVFEYFSGMGPVPPEDKYAIINIKNHEDIVFDLLRKELPLELFMERFKNNVPKETVETYLEIKIPDDFDVQWPVEGGVTTYKVQKKLAEDEEDRLITIHKTALTTCFDEEKLSLVLEAIKDVKNVSLKSILDKGFLDGNKTAVEAVLAYGKNHLEEFNIGEFDLKSLVEYKTNPVIKGKKSPLERMQSEKFPISGKNKKGKLLRPDEQKTLIGRRKLFDAAIVNIKKLIVSAENLDSKMLKIDPNYLGDIVNRNETYRQGLIEFSQGLPKKTDAENETVEVLEHYDPSMISQYGSLSKAIEKARQLKYAEKYSGYQEKEIAKVLEILGIFTRRERPWIPAVRVLGFNDTNEHPEDV